MTLNEVVEEALRELVLEHRAEFDAILLQGMQRRGLLGSVSSNIIVDHTMYTVADYVSDIGDEFAEALEDEDV